jgi:hypothetical protein
MPSRSRTLGAFAAFLLASTVSVAGRADNLQQKANVYTDDVSGGPKTLTATITSLQTGATCEARLQHLGGAYQGWDIKEVGGDRGTPQRVVGPCNATPTFGFTAGRQYEEQTTYFWSLVSHDYAVRRIWVTPPGWVLGPIKMARDAVQPNALSESTFTSNACFPAGPKVAGCMRVWPGEGPKTHLRTGRVSPSVVVHEYGHYAGGYVFGHMDAFGFSVPAALGDCAKFAFQEAVAPMFTALVLHDARYAALAGSDGYGQVQSTQIARWPASCTSPETAYDMARPLEEAFLQALWGTDTNRTVFVDWGAAAGRGMPKSPDTANRIMASALVYGLALNRGQRVDQLASAILEWLDTNEPLRAPAIRRIFAAHGFTPRAAGGACVSHAECTSFRCDNRPGAGCVWQDGMGGGGQFCTTHQQCQSGTCNVVGGLRGTCAAPGKALGAACASHAECKSLRCDNRPGAGCVAQDGGADLNQFCTTHQQCHSGFCKVPAGKIAGLCAPR